MKTSDIKGDSSILWFIILAIILVTAWSFVNAKLIPKKEITNFMEEEKLNVNAVYENIRGPKEYRFKEYERIKGNILNYTFKGWELPSPMDVVKGKKISAKALIKIEVHEKIWGDRVRIFKIAARPESKGIVFKWKVYQFYEKR